MNFRDNRLSQGRNNFTKCEIDNTLNGAQKWLGEN